MCSLGSGITLFFIVSSSIVERRNEEHGKEQKKSRDETESGRKMGWNNEPTNNIHNIMEKLEDRATPKLENHVDYGKTKGK